MDNEQQPIKDFCHIRNLDDILLSPVSLSNGNGWKTSISKVDPTNQEGLTSKQNNIT